MQKYNAVWILHMFFGMATSYMLPYSGSFAPGEQKKLSKYYIHACLPGYNWFPVS